MTEVWTVGHSTRTLDQLVDLLKESRIGALCDIRRYPMSRRHPHFNRENLGTVLPAKHVEYRHVENLGGFRGDYLAYTQTPDFEKGLQELLSVAEGKRTAMMCAEIVFFRCHRRWVSDALVRRGVAVHHIFAPGVVKDHELRGEKPLEEFV